MSETTDLLKYACAKAKESRKYLYGIMIGVAVAALFFWVILRLFDYHLGDFTGWLLSKNNSRYSLLFEHHLDSQSRNLQELQECSDSRVKRLWEILDQNGVSVKNVVGSEILDISNRDRDVIRFNSELIAFSVDRLKKEQYSKEIQTIIDNLQKAYVLIHRDKDALYEEAIAVLAETYKKADKYEPIKLEILRHLTFCNFQLKREKEGEYWQQKALELRKTKKWEWSEYTVRIYWVDLHDLVLGTQKNQPKRAEEAFLRFKDGAGPEFMRSKMRQHKNRIPPQHEAKWQEYIDRLQ